MSDTLGKELVGPVLTILGWMTPFVVGLIVVGNNPATSTEVVSQIWYSMFIFLGIYLMAAIHIVNCATHISGWKAIPVSPFWTFLATFLFIVIAALAGIVGFLLGVTHG